MFKVKYKHIWEQAPEPKSSYTIFYNRLVSWYSQEQALDPAPKNLNRRRSPARDYWESYEWEKSSYNWFMTRVRRWISFDIAINPNIKTRWLYKKEKELIEITKSITHAQAKAERYNEDYYKIEVTYNKEEAQVFHNSYRSKIKELEDKIYREEEILTLKELERKLNKIKQEYQVFLSYNPI